MHSLYERNIDFIKQNMPGLYEKIEIKGDNYSDSDYCIVRINEHENIQLSGKFIHSQYNPHMDGKFIVMNLDGLECDTIFVMGIGLGYHLKDILENFLDKNKLFYEPNIEVFHEFLKRNDISEYYKENVMFVVGNDKQDLLENMITLFMSFKIYRVSFIGLPTYIVEYEEIWKHLTKEFIDFFSRYAINVKTSAIYINQWMVNYFRNLRFYAHESGLEDYQKEFKGVPGIIVSSGPSLTKNVHLLNKIMDKAVIVSAGSSINALQDREISPHIMLAVDGSQLMSDEYNAVKDKSILFAHIMNTHYDCIEKYTGPKMHIRVTSEPHIEFFEKVNDIKTPVLQTGGSCANVAMDFLVKLGCDPIILIGQDLCFTGNVTHAEGVWDRVEVKLEDTKNKDKGYIYTKDIFGNSVYTNRSFASMHKWFEEYIYNMNKNEHKINVINATEGGLFITGATHMTFKEAIETHCIKTRDIKKNLEDIHKESSMKYRIKETYVNNFLEIVDKEMRRLEKLSKLRYKHLEIIMERLGNDNGKNADIRKKINRITTKMEKKDIYFYMIWQPCHDLIYSIKNNSELEVQQEQNIIKKLIKLYNGLKAQYDIIHERIHIIKHINAEAIKEIKGNEMDD